MTDMNLNFIASLDLNRDHMIDSKDLEKAKSEGKNINIYTKLIEVFGESEISQRKY